EPERVRRVFAEHRLRVERRLSEARTALEEIDRIIREGALMETESRDVCSFCHKPFADERPERLTGADARICGERVRLAREVIEDHDRNPGPPAPPRPVEELQPGWLACAFCGKDKSAVRKLVAGPNVAICDACLAGVVAA